MTKARHARQDLVGGLGPYEGRGPVVREVDVAPNGGFQLARAAMDAAADLLLRQRGEPALDQVDPCTPRRREVDMEARMPRQPAVDQRRLVRAGAVDDEMNVELRRDRGIDRVEEGAERARPVPLVELADDLAALGIKRGEERRRPVARVVIGPTLGLPGRIGRTGCVRSSA